MRRYFCIIETVYHRQAQCARLYLSMASDLVALIQDSRSDWSEIRSTQCTIARRSQAIPSLFDSALPETKHHQSILLLGYEVWLLVGRLEAREA